MRCALTRAVALVFALCTPACGWWDFGSARATFCASHPQVCDPDAGAQGALQYMIGYGGGGATSAQVAAAEGWLGRPLDLGVDVLTIDAYTHPVVNSTNGRQLGRVLDFDMLSMSYTANQSLQDMDAAASGAYDSVYAQMVQTIATPGVPTVSCRIGPGMNGDWQPWSAVDGNTHNATPARYIATFKRIAQIIRAHSPNTLIEWNVSIQPSLSSFPTSSHGPLDYWVGAYDPTTNPGGADVISMDFNEGSNGADFDADALGGAFGLSWLSAFAQQNGVKVALSTVSTGLSGSPGEGSGCPCSNDAAFMQRVVGWIDSLGPDFTHFCFSAWSPADDLLAPGNQAIQNVWRARWSGTHFSGVWWKGSPVPSQQP
jgi:hypothetical protein